MTGPRTSRIRPACTRDVPALGRLLSAAFDEPVTRWLVPDRARHTPVMAVFFEIVAADALGEGSVDVLADADGELLAAAVWFDRTRPQRHRTSPARPSPEPEPEPEPRPEPVPEPDPRLDAALGPDARRWHTLDGLMTGRHPDEPHQYLLALGVRPDLQGLCLGSRLLDACHRRIGGAAAYLEATSVDSRRLYLRHGYADRGAPLQLPDGPPMWPMWRPPDPVIAARWR